MRITSSTLSGSFNDEISVIRGSLGTVKENHSNGSLVKKIKPLAVEFRRPSIVRASGHTFEYLGFGPGNYSTGLPQVQVRSLSEKEEYLAQAQEKSCGIIVYTGMNNDGDFFIGNKKINSATGKETNFDIPVSTITGEDPSRLSVVFDEVIVKERILVEGGNSGTVLSQFDGPVKFNKDLRINAETVITDNLRLNGGEESTSTTTGDMTVVGGVGVGGNVTIGGSLNVTSGTTFSGITTVGVSLLPDTDFGANIGSSSKRFDDAYFGNIKIAVTDNNTIDTSSGDLKLNAISGSIVAIQTNTTVTGTLQVTDDITAFWSSDERLKDNITPIDDPLSKVLSISGNTFDWNDNSRKTGSHDVGLIAQEIEKVLPEAVIERPDGYLAVDYIKVVPLLVEAVKELSAKIDSLQQNS